MQTSAIGRRRVRCNYGRYVMPEPVEPSDDPSGRRSLASLEDSSPVFVSHGWHQAMVFFVLGMLWLISGFVWLGFQWPGILVVTIVPAGLFLLFAWVSRRQATKEQQVLDAARSGSVVCRWDLTGKQADWFRQSRRKRRRQKWLVWVVLPMIAGCLLAVLVGFYNLLQGVSASHALKMVVAITILTLVVTSVIGTAFWIWTWPGLRALNHHELPVLFLSDSIRVGDETVYLSRWRRSREFSVIKLDEFCALAMKFTGTTNSANGFRTVVTKEIEIPIPFECKGQSDEVIAAYRLQPN